VRTRPHAAGPAARTILPLSARLGSSSARSPAHPRIAGRPAQLACLNREKRLRISILVFIFLDSGASIRHVRLGDPPPITRRALHRLRWRRPSLPGLPGHHLRPGSTPASPVSSPPPVRPVNLLDGSQQARALASITPSQRTSARTSPARTSPASVAKHGGRPPPVAHRTG
jgi:hypothetical protein